MKRNEKIYAIKIEKKEKNNIIIKNNNMTLKNIRSQIKKGKKIKRDNLSTQIFWKKI